MQNLSEVVSFQVELHGVIPFKIWILRIHCSQGLDGLPFKGKTGIKLLAIAQPEYKVPELFND